jgi:putative transposase
VGCLTHIEVRWHGRAMGVAVPHRIGRHVHHKARPDDTAPPAATATGIDYLRLVEQQHSSELAERVRYSQLPDDGHVPGQLTLPGTDEADRTDEAGEAGEAGEVPA